MSVTDSMIFLYGPPGSGKSATGKRLAEALSMPFLDLDTEIEKQAGKTIADIFMLEGEAAFRQQEADLLKRVVSDKPAVVALGGGALLDPGNRELVEAAGLVLLLIAREEVLLARMGDKAGQRPLLGEKDEMAQKLHDLLQRRKNHYASFPQQIEVSSLSVAQATWAAQVQSGSFHVTGMGTGYDVRIRSGGLDHLGEMLLERGLKGPLALVSDDQVAPIYANRVAAALEAAGYRVVPVVIPAGEANKTLQTVTALWEGFLAGGLERSSTVVALGGGVVGDQAGFAAATYLRGIRWVAVPTTLLSMVDASLGGKTGADLPQGKNLIGAFHSPAFVLADPQVLRTLPLSEQRSGMAEVVKHGVLADPALFDLCKQGWAGVSGGDPSHPDWQEIVRRGMAVKVRYIQEDPYEKGIRAALNLGHTIGHAVEQASSFRVSHGEAVAIGMVAEARLAEELGLAEAGLGQVIAAVLEQLGLPVRIPDSVDTSRLLPALSLDKKKADGKVRFALPLRIGEVRTGITVDLDLNHLMELGK